MEDNNRTVTNNQELAEQFNTFFSKIIQNLKIDNKLVEIVLNFHTFDPALKAIKKYGKLPCIIKIKEKMKHKIMSFSFSFAINKKF